MDFNIYLFFGMIGSCSFTTTNNCSTNVCENGGSCIFTTESEKCVCTERYFGVLCTTHTSSYTIFLQSGKKDVLPLLSEVLEENSLPHLNLVLDPSNTRLDVIFLVENLEEQRLKSVLGFNTVVDAAINSMRDFDECHAEEYPVTCETQKICVNAIGSFQCSCKDGFKEENKKCVDNSLWNRSEIQIWLIVVGSALVLLVIMITIIYRKRYRFKMLKRKKQVKNNLASPHDLQRNNTFSSGSTIPLQDLVSEGKQRYLQRYEPPGSSNSDVLGEINDIYASSIYSSYPDFEYTYYEDVYNNSKRDTYKVHHDAVVKIPKWCKDIPEYDQQAVEQFMSRGYSLSESKRLALQNKNKPDQRLDKLTHKKSLLRLEKLSEISKRNTEYDRHYENNIYPTQPTVTFENNIPRFKRFPIENQSDYGTGSNDQHIGRVESEVKPGNLRFDQYDMYMKYR